MLLLNSPGTKDDSHFALKIFFTFAPLKYKKSLENNMDCENFTSRQYTVTAIFSNF